MIPAFGLEYAQARLQARLAGHPDAYAWRRIESARSLTGALEAARHAPFLAGLAAGLTPVSDAHAIERAGRTRLRALVGEVAGWLPEEWRGAVAWTRVLVDLPLLVHLRSDAPPPEWLREDAALRSCLDPDPAVRRRALEGGALAPIALRWNDAASLRHAWLAEWRRRWPRRAERSLLDALSAAVAGHLRRFAATPVAQAWQAREALRARLGRLFRRSVLDPAAAFGYLALAALDAERLRAELLRRAVFEEGRFPSC